MSPSSLRAVLQHSCTFWPQVPTTGLSRTVRQCCLLQGLSSPPSHFEASSSTISKLRRCGGSSWSQLSASPHTCPQPGVDPKVRNSLSESWSKIPLLMNQPHSFPGRTEYSCENILAFRAQNHRSSSYILKIQFA